MGKQSRTWGKSPTMPDFWQRYKIFSHRSILIAKTRKVLLCHRHGFTQKERLLPAPLRPRRRHARHRFHLRRHHHLGPPPRIQQPPPPRLPRVFRINKVHEYVLDLPKTAKLKNTKLRCQKYKKAQHQTRNQEQKTGNGQVRYRFYAARLIYS